MTRRRKINRIEDILKNVSNKPKLKQNLEMVEVLDQVTTILGKNLQSYITKKYFKNGIIYIDLSSSVLRSELSYQKQELIDNINLSIGRKIVKDIILK